MLNRLILNRLTLSLLLAISLPAALVGCQSTSFLNTQQTTDISTTSIDDKSKPIDGQPVQKSQVMQWSAHYDWQLTQVINQNGDTVNIADFAPITLQVEPSSVIFTQDCDQYRMDFVSMSAPPYPYYSYLDKVPTTCNHDNTPNNNTAIKDVNNLQTLIDKTFPLDLILSYCQS